MSFTSASMGAPACSVCTTTVRKRSSEIAASSVQKSPAAPNPGASAPTHSVPGGICTVTCPSEPVAVSTTSPVSRFHASTRAPDSGCSDEPRAASTTVSETVIRCGIEGSTSSTTPSGASSSVSGQSIAEAALGLRATTRRGTLGTPSMANTPSASVSPSPSSRGLAAPERTAWRMPSTVSGAAHANTVSLQSRHRASVSGVVSVR